MEELTLDRIKAIVGQLVTVTDGEGTQVNLQIADAVASQMHGDMWHSFSVFLKGPADTHLPQGNYRVAHPHLGEMILFITPTSPTDYQVVVNRKRCSASA